MTFKKPTRAGLVALALGVLFALFLSMSVIDRSYAEEAAAPAAAVETPPACDAKTLTNCTPNAGDTAWMMTSVALVLLMTIPGLGLFYGGMVRKKNVGDTVMTSFAITCLVSILWLICTYSLAFRSGTPFIGGLDRAFLQGIVSDIAKGIGNPNPLAPTIPETVYICFQLTFAIITPALIAGAFAERMKFSAMLWFIGLWAIFVYAPVAHWVWGPDGFLNAGNADGMIKVLDFAGGTVVHINSGVAGLMACILLGKRKETGPGHNMVLTFIGASLLWVGWFGFNAGSAVSAGMVAGMAMLVTHMATAHGFTWMIVEWMVRGKPTVIGTAQGRGGSRGDHTRFWLRLPDRRGTHRHRRRHRRLPGLHRPEVDAVLKSACRLSLEGIVSKKLSAPYRSGRGEFWTKAKCRAGHEVVIGGWVRPTAASDRCWSVSTRGTTSSTSGRSVPDTPMTSCAGSFRVLRPT